ncbi:MAG: alpha/beta fold hydrolase [Acidobacteriota bacterium]
MLATLLRSARHLKTPALLLSFSLLSAWSPAAAGQVDPSGSSTFVVLLDGIRVGTESMTISRVGDEWILSGSGFVRPPLDLSTMRFEVRYGPDWEPRRMAFESALRGTPMAIATTFAGTSASNAMTQGDQQASNTHEISPRAVVIPNNFFAAYEGLAVRLPGLERGARLPIYVPPVGETTASVTAVTPRRVSLGDETLDLNEYAITIMNSTGAMPAEMWVDGRGRMARLVLPTASLVVIREDLAHVLAREERVTIPGDDDVFIPAVGFVLGATFTKAPGTTGRAPAVVLVSGPGPQDRDYLLHGLPIYGHLAQALSSRGYVVVRYDPRGTGRSGGRAESSRIDEYAQDVQSIVDWLRRRDDVDRDRIAVVAFGDTGPIALTAARRTNRIKAVALINSPGLPGRELMLERQRLALAESTLSDAERQARLELQQAVIDAALSDEGWERLPEEVRRQADTQWFRSWVAFDPAQIVRRLEQPLLAVHGSLDTEVPAAHAEALAELGRARRNRDTRLVILDGINHLLLPARTGRTDEYAELPRTGIAPEAVDALAGWLDAALPRR